LFAIICLYIFIVCVLQAFGNEVDMECGSIYLLMAGFPYAAQQFRAAMKRAQQNGQRDLHFTNVCLYHLFVNFIYFVFID
jgi:hypothetical protein